MAECPETLIVPMRHLLLVLSAAALLAPVATAQTKSAFACPATLTVTEQAQAPDGWTGPAVKAEHLLQTAKIYNGDPGKEEYDLRPDDEAQKGKTALLTWILKDYRTMNLFMRCYYYDTKATVTANIPTPVNKCSVTLEMKADGTIVGKSQMKCE
jgi:hypothetical protein